MKRALDIVLSVAALAILAPVILLVAVLVKMTSRGRILFRQQRIGRYGQLFTIFKFRSMVVGSEKRGSYFTEKDDPRITPLGRFLRHSSLDELPQLFNVLRGDMSIVGPRPDVPEQRSLYTDEEWFRRHSVRPGITGLAQATLRSNASVADRKALDLQYVDRISMRLDLKIMLMTAQQVFAKGGN